MIKGVILDFDQTIVDSSRIQKFRDARNWAGARENFCLLKLNKCFWDFYSFCKDKNIRLAVVSKAPKAKYISPALVYLNVQVEAVIGYENGGGLKPGKEPMVTALQEIGLSSDQVISIGDDEGDSVSAKAAGIFAIQLSSCLANPSLADLVCGSFEDCLEYVRNNWQK